MDYQRFEGSAGEWNRLLARFPSPHFLQSEPWGKVKADFGWRPFPLIWTNSHGSPRALALVLERAVTLPLVPLELRLHYAPRGPLLQDWGNPSEVEQVLAGLLAFGRKRGALVLKIDPEVPLGHGEPGSAEDEPDRTGLDLRKRLQADGWIFSPDQVQFRNTVLIDLRPEEESLLAAMKQKTRYNVRLASRRGVQVRPAVPEDFEMLYQMYAETSLRDGFVIRDQRYYLTVWHTFYQEQMFEGLIAEVEGSPVAAVIVLRFGGRAWYVYGMSGEAHREKMPNYLLQWEAMRRARAAGCREYDLWGAPDEFLESDPLWGVYRFKQGLAGTVVRTVGAWDYPLRPGLYRVYTRILPRFLSLLRRRGLAATRASLE
jgi:lipid II:glycine glycyltransferase (peptidoglycan interpeptide bridge formation enzyme)